MASTKTEALAHKANVGSLADFLPISVPAGTHGVVFIEFQGPLRKLVELYLEESSTSSDEDVTIHPLEPKLILIERHESCYGNVATSMLLRGSAANPITYKLLVAIYEGECGMPAGNPQSLQQTAPVGDFYNKVSAYTYLYHLQGNDPSVMGADVIIVGIVIQEGIAAVEQG